MQHKGPACGSGKRLPQDQSRVREYGVLSTLAQAYAGLVQVINLARAGVVTEVMSELDEIASGRLPVRARGLTTVENRFHRSLGSRSVTCIARRWFSRWNQPLLSH